MHTMVWLENHERNRLLGRLNVDGKIILEWMLGKLCGRLWIGFI